MENRMTWSQLLLILLNLPAELLEEFITVEIEQEDDIIHIYHHFYDRNGNLCLLGY